MTDHGDPTYDHGYVETDQDYSEADTTTVESENDEDGATPAKRGRRNNERAIVRRIAAKYGELATASAEHLELLSTALGVPNNTTELTIAVVTGSRNELAGLTDTLALSEPSDPYDGMVAAIGLGRTRIKAVWSVMSELGAVTGTCPASDVKAGGSIAKAAGALSQENIEEITAVLALAKK